MGEQVISAAELLADNARRVVERLVPALEEGRIAVHLIPDRDMGGGAIDYVLPEDLQAHCDEIEALGRSWQIVPVESVQADLTHAQQTIDWYDSLKRGFN